MPSCGVPYEIADYRPQDESSWLRCRVLSFLDTTYYDDVVTAKPDRDAPVQLVVRGDGAVVALLDASLDGANATIECVAVHLDHRRRCRGSAGDARPYGAGRVRTAADADLRARAD